METTTLVPLDARVAEARRHTARMRRAYLVLLVVLTIVALAVAL